MQITLEALESALAPIEAVGRGELTFDVSGVSMTLRILLPEEESEVQQYAAQALSSEDKDENVSTVQYLERFKLAILSYAVIAVGDQDFRNVEYIETGETLPNGQKVKILRHKALRQILSKWSGPLRVSVFRKYSELVGTVERQAEKAIEFEPTDLDAEIERLEKRLRQMREEKNRVQQPNTTDKITQAIVETDKEERQGRQDDMAAITVRKAAAAAVQAKQTQTEKPVAQADVSPPTERQPIIPQQGTPPAISSVQEVQPPVQPQSQVKESAPQPSSSSWDEVQDSMVDASDKDDLDAAIVAENRRLLEARRGAGKAPPTATPSVINAALQAQAARKPVYEASEQSPPEQLPPEQPVEGKAEFVGRRNGLETFRMPPEELTRRAAPPPGPAPVNVRQSDKGSQNPRFRPPKTGP